MFALVGGVVYAVFVDSVFAEVVNDMGSGVVVADDGVLGRAALQEPVRLLADCIRWLHVVEFEC